MFSFEKVTAVLGKLRNKTPNNLYLPLSRHNSTRWSHLDCDVQDRFVRHGQGKAIPVLSWTDPEGSSFKTRQDKTRQDKTRQDKTRQDKTRQDKTRQKVVRFWTLHNGRLYPREIFLLEAASTPGPQSGRKNYVNEKFQWHIRTHDLTACREMPQATALRRAPYSTVGSKYLDGKS